MSATPQELLVDLVATPSVSGNEAVCADRLVEFFEDAGRDAWIDEVGNVRAPADDGVLLTSHLDTVPGDIPVSVEDGVLSGRGSVDAKGPLAAMAVGAVRSGASFAAVVQEETDSTGARHLIETRDEPDAVVNGEPSGWDAMTLGYRGIMTCEYTVETDGAHSSRPEPNAIQYATDWWSQVECVFGDDRPVFEQVTATPTAFDGGLTEDGLAVQAGVNGEFRIPVGETAGSVQACVEAETKRGTLTWSEPIPPVCESPRTRVARAFRAAIRDVGGDPHHLRKSGTSDMNLYADAWDCPMATYGPGDSSLDHAPNEQLPLNEFEKSIDVLEHVAATLTEGDA